MFKIYKRLMDVFSSGELIRIKKTGEVFIYEGSTGGANFSSYLECNINGVVFDYGKALHVDDVEKVSIRGNVIDSFEQYARK